MCAKIAASSFFFSSRRRHTRSLCDWSSDVCSSDLFDLGNGRAGNCREGDVALCQVHKGWVRMVHVEGAARAGFLPLRTEHKVIDDELAFAVEEIGERFLAAGGIENVVLFDLDPG